jgi:hypothetical protein
VLKETVAQYPFIGLSTSWPNEQKNLMQQISPLIKSSKSEFVELDLINGCHIAVQVAFSAFHMDILKPKRLDELD